MPAKREFKVSAEAIAVTFSNGTTARFKVPRVADLLEALKAAAASRDEMLIARLCQQWGDRSSVTTAELKSRGFIKSKDLVWLRAELNQFLAPPIVYQVGESAESVLRDRMSPEAYSQVDFASLKICEYTAAENTDGSIVVSIPSLNWTSVHAEADGFHLEFADRAKKEGVNLPQDERNILIGLLRSLRIMAATMQQCNGEDTSQSGMDANYATLTNALPTDGAWVLTRAAADFFL